MLLRLLLGLSLGTALLAQRVAISLDDAPANVPTPKWTASERNERLLAILKRHHVRVATFANGIDGGDTPEGRRLLARWGEEGHRVGNHTYSHLNLQKVSLERFTQDFLKEDDLIKGMPGYVPWLRFPYLKEGDTPEKRDGMRKVLKDHGYRNAAVTISTFDWLIDEHLRSALKRKPDTNLEPYRTYYLQHLATLFRHYRNLGKEVTGREVAHVVLLHSNLLNALFMDDVLAMLEKNGWTVISPEEAYADPIYGEEPRTLATGESLLWALAKDKGIEPGSLQSISAYYTQEQAMLEELGL
jgi:peptidoglycan/xylan/chitin deacetylase (PgdA/CDA1 family)